MKIAAICDNAEICAGLRLVGVEGVVVSSAEEFDHALIKYKHAAIVVVPKRYGRYTSYAKVSDQTNQTNQTIVEI